MRQYKKHQDLIRSAAESMGYDLTLPSNRLTLKNLARSEKIQHLIHALQNETDKEIQAMPMRPFRVNKFAYQPKTHGSVNNHAQLLQTQIVVKAPNGQAGSPFCHSLKLSDHCLKGQFKLIQNWQADTYPDVNFNLERGEIYGVVHHQGEVEIGVWLIHYAVDGREQVVKLRVLMTVLPDPRTLWKNLPSDTSARYHKSDTFVQSGQFKGGTLYGASQRGRSHAHKGIHRDDELSIMPTSANGWSVFAVADGAGSAEFSRKGAEIACRQGTKTLHESLSGSFGDALEQRFFSRQDEMTGLNEIFQHTMVKAVYAAAKGIQTEVEAHTDLNLKQFSTTLLLCAVKPVDTGYLVFSFWVGDGAAVVLQNNGDITFLGVPDSGTYVGQTRFLDHKMFHDQSVYQRVKLCKIEDLKAIVLATDGITDPKFSNDNELMKPENWHRLFAELTPMLDQQNAETSVNHLLAWMNFFEKGHHDDRTIAIYQAN